MRVERVYYVSRGAAHRRLRVRIDGKAYTCGAKVSCVNGVSFYIHAIDASGLVEFRHPNGITYYTIKTKGIRD